MQIIYYLGISKGMKKKVISAGKDNIISVDNSGLRGFSDITPVSTENTRPVNDFFCVSLIIKQKV